MRRIFGIAILMLAFFANNFAQGRFENKEMFNEEFSKKLNLTASQLAQVKAIKISTKEKMEDLSKQNLADQEHREYKMAIGEKSKAEFINLLTMDQLVVWNQLKREKRNQFLGRQNVLKETIEKMNLSQNQRDVIRTIMKKSREDIKEVREQHLDSEASRALFAKIKEQVRLDLSKILNPVQLKQIDEAMAQKKGRRTIRTKVPNSAN